MDDFMERIEHTEEVKETYNVSSKLVDITRSKEEHYNELVQTLVKDGWPEAIVVETLKKYKDEDAKKILNIREALKREGKVTNSIEEAINEADRLITDYEFKQRIQDRIAELKREDQLKEEAKKYNAERQKKLAMEEASRLDYTTLLDQYIVETKRTKCVSARELSDRLMNKLTNQEREEIYFNRPMYAAYKNIDTPLFDETFNECIAAYQKSIVIQKVITQYLDKVSPNRDRDEYEIDKLISMLPEDRKTMDDRNYQAYTAICWLQDTEAQREALEEFKVEDFENDEVKKEFTAQAWADVMQGEPYSIAYRNAFEKAIGVVSKQCGKIKAFPTHIADVASQSLSLGEKETLGQNLYDKIRRDKEIERLVQEKNRERDELKAQLEAERVKNEKLTQQSGNPYNPYVQSAYSTNKAYVNTPNSYYNQQPINNTIEAKYIGIGVNVALLLLCLLFEKLTRTNTFILLVGIGLSTYGWIISPSRKDYEKGNYYNTHPTRFMQTVEHRSQSKGFLFILGGYALFLVCFLLMAAF